ncbi:MAG: response regulator [Rhodomicrobium sp.]|nr:MAG: response regulator [Rhodomicrobium sp.]
MSELTESTIIMVDDNVDEIFLTRRLVRRDGIVNRFVSEKKPENLMTTLEELEEMGVRRETFLILLDVNMPRINGFETLKRLRAHDRYKDIPVLMLSASDDVSDMFESFEHGSNGYLVKPFSGDEFFAAMENIPNIKKKLMQ